MNPRLTSRQTDVLKLVAQGLTDAEIGAALGIGTATVHRHVKDIREALNAENRAHAVYLGLAHGLIRTEPQNV